MLANYNFTQNLFSCPVVGQVSAEGQCVWGAAQAFSINQDGGKGSYGYNTDGWSLSTGIQNALSATAHAGFGINYEDANYTSGTTNSAVDLFSAGAILKDQWGDYTVGAVVTGGAQWSDSTRNIPMAGDTAHSNQTIYFGSVAGRVSRPFDFGSGYVKPWLEAAGTWLDSDGFTETGAGALNLKVQGQSDFVFRATPMLEVGTEMAMSENVSARPFARAGVSFYAGADNSVTGKFVGVGSTVTMPINQDDVVGELAAGVDFIGKGGWTLRALYQGRFSASGNEQIGTLKAGIKF